MIGCDIIFDLYRSAYDNVHFSSFYLDFLRSMKSFIITSKLRSEVGSNE